jgi:hypothetical protein
MGLHIPEGEHTTGVFEEIGSVVRKAEIYDPVLPGVSSRFRPTSSDRRNWCASIRFETILGRNLSFLLGEGERVHRSGLLYGSQGNGFYLLPAMHNYKIPQEGVRSVRVFEYRFARTIATDLIGTGEVERRRFSLVLTSNKLRP